MKILNKNFLLAALSVFLFAGCSDDDGKSVIEVKSFIVNETTNDTLLVDKGATLQITVKTTPANQPVWYYSSNTNIFSVTKEGLISGIAGGKASLLITAPNGAEWTKKTIMLTVVEYVDSINLVNPGTRIELGLGQKKDVSDYFVVYPSTATNATLAFEPEDSSIASVDSDGTLTGLKRGITHLVARSTDGTNIVSGKIEVEVTPLLDKENWEATAEYEYGYYPVTNLIDYNDNSFWLNLTGIAPCWVMIDMNKIVTFDKIGLVQSPYTRAKETEIYISSSDAEIEHDDPSFTLLGTIAGTDVAYEENVLDLYPADEKKARHIKLNLKTFYSGIYYSLSEVNVYYQK